MTPVAQFRVSREPDIALSYRGSTRGFNLLTSAEDSQALTASPAALLLTPAQTRAIAPLLAQVAARPQKKITSKFDALHDQLLASFEAGNYDRLAQQAATFLKAHPIIPLAGRSAVEQRIRRFFIFKGKRSSQQERLALYDGLEAAGRSAWMRQAHARMDIEKAQVLATAVSGIAPPAGADLLGGLKADLAYSVLAASVESLKSKTERRNFPNKYVDQVLELSIFLPAFAFDLEVCKLRDGNNTKPGRLAQRLQRLKDYDTAVQKALAALATDGRGDGSHSSQKACECKCDDAPCWPVNPCCGEVNWYTTELLTLKARTHCYKPSDIAYIENIAPFETRIRTHGFTRVVAETTEEETTTNREEERDHQVTDRFNLQKEMQNNQKASLDVDARLSGKYTKVEFEVKTNSALSKESAYREAREQAREAVDKATLKIQEQTRTKRTRSVTTTTTESNKHKFKNNTPNAAVAKYFWVTQEKRGQLFSHGPAMMVELFVPSPAMLFSRMEQIKWERGMPKKPEGYPVKPTLSPADITRENYRALATQYGITGYETPPPLRDTIVRTYGGSAKSGNNQPNVDVPDNYTATKMEISSVSVMPFVPGNYISFSFGGKTLNAGLNSINGVLTLIRPQPVTINERSDGNAIITDGDPLLNKSNITVAITFTPDPVDISAWQNSIHALVLAKYEADLKAFAPLIAAYEEALAAYKEKREDSIKGRHPFACEEIMRTEMKRSAIFMLCGEFVWPGVMNMNAQPCGLPWPDRQKATDAMKEWYFFDRAFDWNLASFTFYDYFRNPMCQWVDTFEPDEPNFLFKAFLRAGYGRIQIPVSPGMEEDMLSYLKTGGLSIWGASGDWPKTPDDPRWISVIDEIKHSYDCRQQDREGYAELYPDPQTGAFDHRIRVYTDRYWDDSHHVQDDDKMNLDLDHQIFIDGLEYRILSIIADPDSPVYSNLTTSTMSWIISLDRKVEAAPYIDPAAKKPVLQHYNYAVGAQYIGAPFHFDLPTDLIWIGDQCNPCLPCYPINCECKPEDKNPENTNEPKDDKDKDEEGGE